MPAISTEKLKATTDDLLEKVVGMKEVAAQKAIFASEIHPRIVERDGQSRPTSGDSRPDRINLTIMEGVVTEAVVG